MGKQRIKPNYRRRVRRSPDLDHCKSVLLNSLGSPASRRVYEYAIDQFIAWYRSEPRPAFNRIVVVRYRMHLVRSKTYPKTVQALLRHSDVKTTLQLYAHSVSADRMTAQGEVLQAILGSKPTGCGLKRFC